MIKSYVYILLVLIIFQSCDEESIYEKFENSFPVKKELNSQIINHNKDLLGNPTKLRIADSLLFVLDPDLGYSMKIINNNNLTLVKNILKNGRGPGEYGMIPRFELLDHRKLAFNDDIKNNYYEVSIQSKQFNPEILIEKNLKIEQGRIFNTVRLGDSYVSTGIFEKKGRLLLSSVDSIDICDFFDDYPLDDHPKMSTMNKGMAYQTHFTSCVNNHFTGYSLTSGEIIFYAKEGGEIIKKNKYQLFTSEFESNSINGYGVVYSKDSQTGFLDIVQKDKFVYALYSGRSFRESGMEAYMGNKIFIFTHSGVPVACYHLDIDIRTFDVDENGTIYALAINPYPQLVKFTTINI